MIARNLLILWVFLLPPFQSLWTTPLEEQFKEIGYLEITDKKQEASTFELLYIYFDELVEYLQTHPVWAQKLYLAKERFIRSKDKAYYSTDFFGLYDESNRRGRDQISFYYSTHFHEFINSHYPEFKQVPEIIQFLNACHQIQEPYREIFEEAAKELGLEEIFSSKYNHPPILLKVIKYLPSYSPTRPHYDGSAFTLFLDSTDPQALLLSPYKSSFTLEDFSSPQKFFSQNPNQSSIFLIPGALLTEFLIFPTPHFVSQSGKTRHATIAFAMRPSYTAQIAPLSFLPNIND